MPVDNKIINIFSNDAKCKYINTFYQHFQIKSLKLRTFVSMFILNNAGRKILVTFNITQVKLHKDVYFYDLSIQYIVFMNLSQNLLERCKNAQLKVTIPIPLNNYIDILFHMPVPET